MIPHRTNEPGEPPRRLSPDVERELERALHAFATGQDATGMLRPALESAARDARERNMRAEELLMAFKAVERRVRAPLGEETPSGSPLRVPLIRALLEAYYSAG